MHRHAPRRGNTPSHENFNARVVYDTKNFKWSYPLSKAAIIFREKFSFLKFVSKTVTNRTINVLLCRIILDKGKFGKSTGMLPLWCLPPFLGEQLKKKHNKLFTQCVPEIVFCSLPTKMYRKLIHENKKEEVTDSTVGSHNADIQFTASYTLWNYKIGLVNMECHPHLQFLKRAFSMGGQQPKMKLLNKKGMFSLVRQPQDKIQTLTGCPISEIMGLYFAFLFLLSKFSAIIKYYFFHSITKE